KSDISSLQHDVVSMKDDISSMKSDISSLQHDVVSMKDDISSMKSDISTLQQDVGSMKNDISTLQKDVGDLHTQVAKNTITLEKTQKDVRIMAEVQKAHYEQNQRDHQEMLSTVNSRTNVIELAIKSVSTTLSDVQEESQSLNTLLGQHTLSIETMRRKLAKTP
ncbi:hypothetical protein AAC978_10715, partial [Desulfitobacterium sp. THU1]|uniref:hypothetical protein n=1 Tax=Desulfitobacterium sp. THU1 TaxID=3138072 RepID=UPI00311E3A2B